MAEAHVIFALRRKYAERLGLGDAEAVAQVGAVLLMFAPDEDLAAIKPVRRWSARKGGSGAVWLRAALDILRTANAPLSARELSERIVQAKGVSDPKARASVECSLLATLPKYVAHQEGRPKRWYVER